MIRHLFFIVVLAGCLFADLPPVKTYKTVNEYRSDIYFGNGILTTYDEAQAALDLTLKPAILHDIYNGDKERMQRLHHFDVAYNYSFKEEFGDTVFAAILDLVESYGQLTKTSSAWFILDQTKSALTDLALRPVKNYGVKKISKVLMEYGLEKWIADFFAEKIFNTDKELIINLFADLTGTSVEAHHDHDLQRMVDQYKNSIKSGHGVIIVSHSQGNLFAIEAVSKLDDWMKSYVYHVSIASPATVFASNKYWLISLDNDGVAKTPGSVGTNTRNYARYYTYDIYLDAQDGTEASSCAQTAILQVQDMVLLEGIWLDGYKPLKEKKEIECGGRSFSTVAEPDEWKLFKFNFHLFDFYMGKTVYPTHISKSKTVTFTKNEATDQYESEAHKKIIDAIRGSIDAHIENVSQYEIAKEVGCACSEKYVKVRHKWDEDLTKRIETEKIKNFSSKGKIYPVDGKYILAEYGGEKIEEVNSDSVCLVLKDEQGDILGEISADTREPEVPGGLFTAQLFWRESAVQMELQSSLMGESVSGCGMAAAGSGELTLYDVYPGTYPVSVTGVKGYEELDENLSDTVTLSIGTPGASKLDRIAITDKYQYPNLGVGGHVADIVIFRDDPREPPVPLLVPLGEGGGSGGSSGGSGGGSGGGIFFEGGSSTKIPNAIVKPPLCTPAKSCGCLPCEYNILTYLSQARLGPIAGADVQLYRATDEGKAQRELLYEGKTTTGTSVDEAGIIRLPVPYPQQPESEYSDEQREFLSKIEGYEGDFILEVSGGYDIDADDDLVTDSNFKRFNGVLHLILSKERLMQNDYKVNILTEIGYQLTKDLLGEYYDSRLVKERLDDIASRILIEKIYPDANASIGRDDLMWWIPSAHKNWLVKDYNRYLEPIVKKLYRGEDIYSEAYEYVYTLPEFLSLPLLKSQWFRVDENLSGGSFIGTVEPLSEGESPIESYRLDGDGEELFKIDSDGRLYLEENATLDYETTQFYELSIVARNGAGESRPVTLYVIVNNIPDVPEFKSFEGGAVSENASEGEAVGRVIFDPAGAPIDRIELSGRDAKSFLVELNGTIRVSADAELDYERSPAAHITLKAHNAYGYSRSRALSIVVVDEVDVPMVESVTAKVLENAPAGSVVANVAIKSDDPITDVVLEGRGSENFTIDKDGVIRVADGASLDYEKRVNYSFNVRASNAKGTSRPAPVKITLQNIPDVPELKRSVYRVMEGVPAGTYVGDVVVSNVDRSQVSEYRLLSGSDSFSVDSEGRIYTARQMPSHDKREYFEIFVAAKNDSGWGPKQIQVIYIDTQRPIIGSLSTWVYENASPGTRIGSVPIVRSSSAIERFEITGSGSENFTIDAAGVVTVAPGATLDYESRSYYGLSVRAYNQSGASQSRSLNVRVVDRDDSLVIRGFSTRIHEDLAEGSVLGVVTLLKNGGIEVDRFVMEGEGSEHFFIDRSGLFSIRKGGFDDKVKNLYSFKVWAVGKDESRSNEVQVRIAIDDALRGHPVLAPFPELEVEENATVGSVIGKISVIDDGSSPIERYEVSGYGADSVFGIDKNGTIRLNRSLDFEKRSSYDLMIRAYNRTTYSDVLHLPIKVINIPDTPPELASFSTYSIDENLPGGTSVGKIDIVDQGEPPIDRFTLVGSGAENFVVDLNGTIRVAEDATIDYESRQNYYFIAKAYNIIGASNPANVFISVLNVPEYPPELYDINKTVIFDTPLSTTIANILKSAGDTPVETIELSKESPFTVDKSGNIRLDKPLRKEECSYSLEAKAKNGFGFSDPAKIEIEIEGKIEVEDLVLEVPFGLSSGERAANLTIFEVCKQVDSLELVGDGSGDFTIDSEGTIRVAEGVVLSSYRRQRYDLQVLINGGEYRADVQIDIQRVADSAPMLPAWVEKVMHAEYGERVLLLKRTDGSIRYAEIVDISDPTRPNTVAAIELPSASGYVTISPDGRALAILNGVTVDLLDIEDQIRPTQKGSIDMESDEVRLLYISDDGAKLMAAYPNGIGLYSLASDNFGENLGFKNVSECSLRYGSFAVTDSRLYLACYKGIGKRLYDIEIDGNSSKSVTFFGNMPSKVLPFAKLSKVISKHFEGIESNREVMLDIFYFADEPFKYTPNYPQGKGYRDFVVSEDSWTFYGLDRNGTAIDIVDMQNPIEMNRIGRVDLPLEIHSLSFVKDGVVYIIDRGGSLVAIDVRDFSPLPKPPAILGFTSLLFSSDQAPAVGSKIGKVKVLYSGEGGIDSFYLTGEDAAHFYIDDNGTVYLKEPLDLSSYGWSYRFRVGATNSVGSAEADAEYLDGRISDTGEFL